MLALAIIGGATLVVLPLARHAHASGGVKLTVTPASGAYSAWTQITVTGQNYAPSESVNIYWNYTGPGTGIAVATATADGSGNFTTSFNKILAATGTYTIAGVGVTSGLVATGPFLLLPQLYGGPSDTGPGTAMHVNGNSFGAGEQVNIYWNYNGPGTGTLLTTASGNATGSFVANSTIPMNAASGFNTIAAVGTTSNTVATAQMFVYPPLLTLAPLSGPAGTQLTFSAYGFTGYERVSVYWNNGTTPLSTTKLNAFGYLPISSFTIPADTAPGAYTLKAVGATSHITITNTFTVAVTGSVVKTSNAVSTAWGDFGFGPGHTRENTAETILSPTTAGKLNLKWTATTNIVVKNTGCGAPANVSSPVSANGMVYYATDDGYLNAYDALTGTLKWQFNSNTTFPNCSSPLVDPATGMVFFGTVGYNGAGDPTPFFALDAQTGALKWSVILPWNEYSFPTVAFNTLYFGVSREGYDESLYALDELTGRVNWIQTAPGGVWGEVVADTATNTIFNTVGNPTPGVQARNATTGALLWEYNTQTFGNNDDVGAPLTLSNGLLYVNSKSGIIYALNENTGAVVWSHTIGAQSNQDMGAPSVSANGIVYVGTNDGPIYALSATTGATLWTYNTRGPIYSSPAIANGVVYFASVDHRFYGLNAATGALVWTYLSGAQSYSSPIVVNGWFYCGSSNGKLYAFGL